MSVNEEWICDVSRNDRSIIDIDIVDIVHDVDTFTLAGISRLDDPYILLRIMLLQLLVMSIKVAEFIWKNVGIRYEVEVAFTELFLHSDHIIAQPVLPSDLIALREMIDFLELI